MCPELQNRNLNPEDKKAGFLIHESENKDVNAMRESEQSDRSLTDRLYKPETTLIDDKSKPSSSNRI